MTDPELDDDEPIAPPRPGAHCANHPERDAVVRCVMCDRDVCIACFFPDLGRCQRCIELHPEEVAEPVPFEARGRVLGFFPTIAGVFAPRVSAPGFGIGDSLTRPLLFLLLTFVPIALLRGVIPYTHHVQFASLGKVTTTADVSQHALLLDVARAAGLSLAECVVQLFSLGLCYVSLVGAFGREGSRRIALRTLGYRAFLLPLGGAFGLLPTTVGFVGPESFSQFNLIVAIGTLPLLPFYIAIHRSVRAVARVDFFPGLFVVVVPWLLAAIVGDLFFRAMLPLLPAAFSS